MDIMRSASQRWAGRFLHRTPRRMAASPRQGRRALRPMAEGLEARTLLSVGLDPSFGLGGVAEITRPSTETNRVSFLASNIALQNGQVVAVGTQTIDTYNASGVFQSATLSLAVARLNTNGTIDTTFGSNGVATIAAPAGVTYQPTDIAVQSNGRIVVLATADTPLNHYLVVARLNAANGTLDTSFGVAGIEPIQFSSGGTPQSADADAMAIGPDGKIVAAGTVFTATVDQFGVARLNTNGTLDASFNAVGTQEVPFTLAGNPADADPVGVAVQPTSLGIVVVGNVSRRARPERRRGVAESQRPRLALPRCSPPMATTTTRRGR